MKLQPNIKQKVLICVSHPAHVAPLIAYGAQLIQSFREGSGIVLHIRHDDDEEPSWSDVYTHRLIESQCKHHELHFQKELSKGKSIDEVLAKVSLEQEITLIILGQSPQSRLTSMFSESLINRLLEQHIKSALCIVDVSNFRQSENIGEFESGQSVWLEKQGEQWKLIRESRATSEQAVRGLFFRNSYTEFDFGHFVYSSSNKSEVLEIADGVAKSPPIL